MRTRILPALALAALMGAGAGRAAADDPKLPDAKAFDKLVVDALRDVHNKGADLYNTSKDFPGAYRMYQGGLTTVRPLLAHRPDAQKLIDTGLAAAEKEAEAARKAFVLHETIEAVRKDLKAAIAEKKPDDKKPEVKKPDEPKKPVEPPKKPTEPPAKKSDEPKKPVEPPAKKPDPLPVAPPPKATPKGKDATAGASGNVTLSGKPLAEGELTLVSLNQPKPRVFTAAIKDGKYTLAEAIPPGKYAGAVSGKGVPEKYATAGTSGLTFELTAGASTLDIVLK